MTGLHNTVLKTTRSRKPEHRMPSSAKAAITTAIRLRFGFDSTTIRLRW